MNLSGYTHEEHIFSGESWTLPLMVDVKTCVYLINVYVLQPLNPNPNSQWAAYFKDNEMLLQIDKDCR
mgnify:CR=1 FL=1